MYTQPCHRPAVCKVMINLVVLYRKPVVVYCSKYRLCQLFLSLATVPSREKRHYRWPLPLHDLIKGTTPGPQTQINFLTDRLDSGLALQLFSIYPGHNDVIKWKHFPRCWPFERGIHRSLLNSLTNASDAELWFFYLHLNKRLSKQSRRWWFEMPSRTLWRNFNVSDGSEMTFLKKRMEEWWYWRGGGGRSPITHMVIL